MTESDNIHKPDSSGQPDIYDRIIKYTGMFGGVQLISIILTKIKSVLLGPVGYGITENLNRGTEIIKSSTNLGLTTVAVPEISRASQDANPDIVSDRVMLTRSWALLTAVVGMAACMAFAPLLSRWAFDGDRSYTVSFMVLSFAVAATAVTGGELAVMRGTGMLRQIILNQLISVLMSLFISAPLYWWLRYDGIVPAMALVSVSSMTVACCFSFRRFPYRVRLFSWNYLKQGTGMIGMGINFTIIAFLGAWAWSFLAHYMTVQGGETLTGIYSAGYMLVTYMTTLLFSVIDSEYLPRLSAVRDDLDQAHVIMNNQAMAMMMLAAPFVILFILLAPVAVYVVMDYDKFQPSIQLAQMAAIGLFFKSISQPIAYLVVARIDSRIFLIQESVCFVLLVICVITGYDMAGILGIGVAFAIWELLYLIMILVVVRFRYKFVMSWPVVRNFLIQGAFLSVAVAGVLLDCGAGLAAGIAVCLCSCVFSLRFFARHTTLVPGAISRLIGKTGHH